MTAVSKFVVRGHTLRPALPSMTYGGGQREACGETKLEAIFRGQQQPRLLTGLHGRVMKPDDLKPSSPDDGNTGGSDAAKEFAGALDNFGLTPRPKVKAQRVDPLLGMDLGGVTIVRLIGEGGMGRVYEAKQEKPSRSVAVKVIRAGITSEKTLRRFEREAEFLGRLQHPGIAQIFIVGTYSSDFGDVPFYVMEYLADAKPVTNYAHEHGLSLDAKLSLFKQVCEAVAHGHDRGIVHRDLKPGNILVDAQGIPKVIDFGVARSTDSDLTLESIKTDTGQMIGTVQYMSPEQFGDNPDDLNCRADVYSLGVVLYELISGVPPYSVRKKALHEASRVVCEEVPTPLRSLDKTVPRDVSAIVERCLQKNRRHRYHSAGELAAEIGSFLAGKPVRAKPSNIFQRPLLSRVFGRSNRRWVVMGALAAIGAIAGLVVLARTAVFVQDAEPKAVQQASLDVTSAWTDSGLAVQEGKCYRLTIEGTCTDNTGAEFGPDGAAPAELRSVLGPPRGPDGKPQGDGFVNGWPQQKVLMQFGDRTIVGAVGAGLTFIAPYTDELRFRINDRQKGVGDAKGRLSFRLEYVPRPTFVGPDGSATIQARVSDADYLLFRPDGLQWRYKLDSITAGDFPTLINGIAWWPLYEPRDPKLSTVLATRDFAWAANPAGPRPEVANADSNPAGSGVTPEEPSPKTPGLKFADPKDGEADLSCTIRRP